MTVENIIKEAMLLTETGEGATFLTVDEMLPSVTRVRNTIVSAITSSITEDYFCDYFTTDTVAGQSRYTWRPSSDTDQGFKRLQSLAIKRSVEDEYYSVLIPSEIEHIGHHGSRIAEELSESQGFYDIQGSYITLYPAPSESVNEGLSVKVEMSLPDLTLTDTDLFPGHTELRELESLVVIGLKRWLFSRTGEINKKNDAIQEFDKDLNEAISLMKFKNNKPVTQQIPDLSYLGR